MKKSEIYLLFVTLFIGAAIMIVALYIYIKPSKTTIISDDTIENNKITIKHDNGWIDKISKENQKFSYPVTIYKINL